MKRKHLQRGFTIYEVLTVLAIIAIMTAIAIPNLYSWLPNHRLKQAANDVFSMFQLAKMTAIRANTFCAVAFHQDISGVSFDLVVYEDSDNDLEYDAGERVVRQLNFSDYKSVVLDSSKGGGDGITFTDNDNGIETVAFRPNGLPVDNAMGFGAGSVFLKNSISNTRSIILSSAGNIRVDD